MHHIDAVKQKQRLILSLAVRHTHVFRLHCQHAATLPHPPLLSLLCPQALCDECRWDLHTVQMLEERDGRTIRLSHRINFMKKKTALNSFQHVLNLNHVTARICRDISHAAVRLLQSLWHNSFWQQPDTEIKVCSGINSVFRFDSIQFDSIRFSDSNQFFMHFLYKLHYHFLSFLRNLKFYLISLFLIFPSLLYLIQFVCFLNSFFLWGCFFFLSFLHCIVSKYGWSWIL